MANLVYTSLIFSVMAGLFLVFRKTLNHRYSSRLFYGIWVILLLRLVFPMSFFSDVAPLTIDVEQIQQMMIQKDTFREQKENGGDPEVFHEESMGNILKAPEGENQVSTNNSTKLGKESSSSLSVLFFSIWLGGFSISLGLVMISYHIFRRKIMSSLIPLRLNQTKVIQGLVDNKVSVLMADTGQSPMVMGVLRPKLILTESLFEENDKAELRLKEGAREVIRHELIHLKRKDILVKYLYLFARSIHWFNPIVHIIGPVINEDIELSCDEHLVKAMNPREKKEYCRVILNLASGSPSESTLYSTNFNGGIFFMKKRFRNIMKSGEKKRGVTVSILLALLIMASAMLISCSGEKKNVNPDEFLSVPSYFLFQYRSNLAEMFYESDEKIGLQVLDGIFIYNYVEDKIEVDFALSENAFENDNYVSAAMSENEKKIIITAYDPSNGGLVDYYYEYTISKKTIKRINKSPKEVKTVEYPSTERQNEALKAASWDVLDLRYYPERSDKALYLFKEESLPYKTYIMQMETDKIPFSRLTLTDDGRFQFTYSAVMNYLNFGHYEIEGSKYILNTSDGERTFVFTKDGENLLFNENESYECIMDNREKMKDGAVFIAE